MNKIIIRRIILFLFLSIIVLTKDILFDLLFKKVENKKYKFSFVEMILDFNNNSIYNESYLNVEKVSKKPSKNVKYFNEFNEKKKYFTVVYKEEEIINNKKYIDYATYIRDSENRYYAVYGRIFCLGIPCIDD